MGQDLKNRLDEMFQKEFPGSSFTPEILPGGKVAGTLAWSGFKSKDPVDRQDQVWDLIKQIFERHEILQISTILTVLPEDIADDEAA